MSQPMLKWYPDGKRIAAWWSREQDILLLEVETGILQKLVGLGGGVNDLSWSSDGKRLFTFSSCCTVKTWSLTDDCRFLLMSDFNPSERVLTCHRASISHNLQSNARRLMQKRGAVVQRSLCSLQ
eukprot:454086-Hanusia_phi.AAC.4